MCIIALSFYNTFLFCLKGYSETLNQWEVSWRNRNIRVPRVGILFWNFKQLSIQLYFLFQRIAVGNVIKKQRYVK